VRITLVEDQVGARAVSDLLDRVWGARPGDPVLRPEIVRALAASGGYVAAAHDDDGRLVGASAGWLGHDEGALTLHSHITGTDASVRSSGVGYALKQHQRGWCLARGIEHVRWTFDPLVRRNAWFNLSRLGAVLERYEVDYYGTMTDGINAGDESDRAVVHWDLRRPVGEPATSGSRLVATPEDVEALRRTDPAAAREWRHRLRDALGGALADGWAVAGFTRDGCYVLEPSS
jgi:predicted GNAT superfamily acetyltransferase